MLTRVFLVVCALLLLGSCNKGASSTAGGGGGLATTSAKYPIPFPARPYTEVHASVKKAWELVEVSYFVVNDKYIHATGQTKGNVSQEIRDKIFFVNDTVDNLFKEAIKAEPENPLNNAAYAIYLKPRKRSMGPNRVIPAYEEALAQIDKAIKLWPDESSFYLTKIYILTAPHQAHEWLLEGAFEDSVIAEKMDEVNKLFNQAEKYDPNNSFINYWHAQLLFRYTDPTKLDGVRSRLLREIHAGNQKTDNFFFFPAPLQPRAAMAQRPILFAEQTEPVYTDQWTQFGSYSGQTMEMMLNDLLKQTTWPKDKQSILDIMYMYYSLGRTVPYDRSYFAQQAVVLDKIRNDVKSGTDEARKLGIVGHYLDDQYQTAGNRMFELHAIRDLSQIGSAGINQIEETASRREDVKEFLQGSQAAYLHKFEEEMGVDFPLPEDPEEW